MPDQERINTIIKADRESRRKQRYWYTQTYIAMALTVIRYVQSQIKHIFADKVKSKEINIYLVNVKFCLSITDSTQHSAPVCICAKHSTL